MGTQRDGAPMADRRFVAAGKRCVANESSLDPREKETQRGIYPTLPHAHWISDRSNIKAVFIKTAPRCIFLSLSLSLSCLRNLHQILDVSLNIVGFQRVKRWCFLFPLSRNTQHTTPCYETRSRNEFLFLLDFIHLSTYIFRYLESQRWC